MSVLINTMLGVLFAFSLLTPAQDLTLPTENMLGKSAEQVIAMGRTGWNNYYTDQKGASTLAMSDAERTYGSCMAYLNNRKIAKLDSESKRWYGQLRTQLAIGEEKSVMASYAVSGGGTIWTPIMAGSTANVETVIRDLLNPTRTMPREKQAVYWRELRKMFNAVDKAKEMLDGEDNPTDINHGMAHNYVVELEKSFSNTVPLIRNKPENIRERVIAAYVDMAKTMFLMNPDGS